MEIVEVTYSDGSTGLQVIINNGNGFTAMTKEFYDEQQAAQNGNLV
jgi:hypothetical protein